MAVITGDDDSAGIVSEIIRAIVIIFAVTMLVSTLSAFLFIGFYVLFYRGRITSMGSMQFTNAMDDLHDLEAGCLLTYEQVLVSSF